MSVHQIRGRADLRQVRGQWKPAAADRLKVRTDSYSVFLKALPAPEVSEPFLRPGHAEF